MLSASQSVCPGSVLPELTLVRRVHLIASLAVEGFTELFGVGDSAEDPELGRRVWINFQFSQCVLQCYLLTPHLQL